MYKEDLLLNNPQELICQFYTQSTDLILYNFERYLRLIGMLETL